MNYLRINAYHNNEEKPHAVYICVEKIQAVRYDDRNDSTYIFLNDHDYKTKGNVAGKLVQIMANLSGGNVTAL